MLNERYKADDELKQYRFKICLKCEEYRNERNNEYCHFCGCGIKAKISNLHRRCEKGLW